MGIDADGRDPAEAILADARERMLQLVAGMMEEVTSALVQRNFLRAVVAEEEKKLAALEAEGKAGPEGDAGDAAGATRRAREWLRAQLAGHRHQLEEVGAEAGRAKQKIREGDEEIRRKAAARLRAATDWTQDEIQEQLNGALAASWPDGYGRVERRIQERVAVMLAEYELNAEE